MRAGAGGLGLAGSLLGMRSVGGPGSMRAAGGGMLSGFSGGSALMRAGGYGAAAYGVGALGSACLYCGGTVAHGDDLMPVVAQLEHHEFADIRVVVGNDDPGHVAPPFRVT